MKILFDHNIPAKLRRHFIDHEVFTAGWLGWNELKNGDLLAAAEAAGFPLLLTGDQNLFYQQNNIKRMISLVVISRTDWPAPLDALELIMAAIERALPGSFEFLELPDRER